MVPTAVRMIYNPVMGQRTCATLFTLALVTGAPAIAFADLRISEIMYDPVGTDSKQEWVEVLNTGTTAVDLSGIKFSDKSNHVLNIPPKNGGIGSATLAPGSYAILASDAATFLTSHSGVSQAIDTSMSLNNSGATISLSNVQGVIDSISYTKSLGAAGNGDSLQLHDGAWIPARPTPGAPNAAAPSVRAVAAQPATLQKKLTTAKSKKPTIHISKADAQTETASDSNEPLSIVNASSVPVALSQTAAVGTLGGTYWWLLAAALTGIVVSLISSSKKNEWDIEESE